jgi:hypothetical protein
VHALSDDAVIERASVRHCNRRVHAKQIAHAPQPAMRCPDEGREPVPVAGNAERPLPPARRLVAGRAEGQ